MLDFSHTPQGADVQRFVGPRDANSSFVWQRPRGVSMAHIFCLSFGGNGGNGFVSAAGAAAGGGGGGGSSNQSALVIPLLLLPERLYVHHSSTAGASWVGLDPSPAVQANATLVFATAGANGTTATSSLGAAGGTASAAPTMSQMPLSGLGFSIAGAANQSSVVAGQPGGAGGSTVGTDVEIPVTGLCATGGSGGGGHGTTTGSRGGQIYSVSASFYTTISGGAGTTSTTVPAQDGNNGYNMGGAIVKFFCGGTGGSACHSNATGAGLFAGNGGVGFFGSGGGGGGASITGATGGQGGLGGPGLIVITAW